MANNNSKSDPPQISDAEWTVMKMLWRKQSATTSEVIKALEGSTRWKPSTIQTLLGRLVQKGVLSFDKQGREYNYRPVLNADECRHTASRSFLSRVFDGRVAPLLATLVEHEELSSEDIADLKRILDEGSK